MKKKSKVRGLLLLLLATVLLVTAAWQKPNLEALLLRLRYSDDTREELLKKQDRDVEDSVAQAIQEVGGAPLFVLSEEERSALRSGELSEEDALALVLGGNENTGLPPEADISVNGTSSPAAPDTASPSPAAQTDTPASSVPSPAPASSAPAETSSSVQTEEAAERQARIRLLVARVYVMRDSYVARLEQIRLDAIAEYTALPENARTTSAKAKLAASCIDRASALESECDGRIEDIYDELTSLLRAGNGDLSLAEQIKSSYAEEKALKKAEYLDRYLH